MSDMVTPAARSCRHSAQPLWIDRLGTVEYRAAWDVQRANADARRAGTGPDVLMLLEHDEVAGPVNLAGPEPATNAQFTSAFAEVLHRPAAFVVPGAVLRTALGQLAEELVLTGPFAVPAVLQKHGYAFRHLTIRDALQAAIERP